MSPKKAKKFLKITVLWTTISLGFKHGQIQKTANEISKVCKNVDIGPKRPFLLILTFSSLSRKLIMNAWFVPKLAFERYFIDGSRKSKKLNVSCQYGAS